MSLSFVRKIEEIGDIDNRLKIQSKSKKSIPRGHSKDAIDKRWKFIIEKNKKYKEYMKNKPEKEFDPFYRGPREELLTDDTFYRSEIYKNNIENFVGTVQVPVAFAGPLKVSGLYASGEYMIPLATTEAALVASYARGMASMNLSGGCRSVLVREAISRDPTFNFKNIIEVGHFLVWARKNEPIFKKVAEKTTHYGKLIEIRYTIDCNLVHMKCSYTSGDATGQNMVSIASEEIVQYILKNSPVKPMYSALEGGLSGDKKASMLHAASVRGKKVCCECVVTKEVIHNVMRSSVDAIAKGFQRTLSGYMILGSVAFNAHFANGITAMYLAMGLDPACVSESHIGSIRVNKNDDGDLYLACSIPNILCGTVGGGTKLPTSRACLELMGLYGPGKSQELAEVIGGCLMAGELSLGIAVLNGNFAKAHQVLARHTDEVTIDLEKDDLQDSFMKCQVFLSKISHIPDTKSILRIYGLYKQATVGDINQDKPGIFEKVKIRKKWQAWNAEKGKTKEVAMKEYVELVMKLFKEDEAKSKKDTEEAGKKMNIKQK